MTEIKETIQLSADRQRLRVLHVPAWYPSEKNPVAGTFVQEHVKASAIHNNVVVLYSEGIDWRIRGLYQVQDGMEDGIRTLRLRYRKSPLPKSTYFIYLWALFRVFRRLLKEGFRPDVIHAHVYSAAVPAVVVGIRYGIPVVVTEHFSGFRRGLVRGVERLKARFAFNRATAVLPVSADLGRHIQALGINTYFEVVPNTVDTDLFVPKKTCGVQNGVRKRLLVVALLTPAKGIPTLLDALANLSCTRDDFELDLVGDGPNRREYEELAVQIGVSGLVHFHGLKPKRQVARYMQEADVFVLPSHWENLPCVIIEALSSGLPVVSTTVGGIPEMIDSENGVLVKPGASDELAQALSYMLDSLNQYDRRRIRDSAVERYGYPAVGTALTRLYQSVLAGCCAADGVHR